MDSQSAVTTRDAMCELRNRFGLLWGSSQGKKSISQQICSLYNNKNLRACRNYSKYFEKKTNKQKKGTYRHFMSSFCLIQCGFFSYILSSIGHWKFCSVWCNNYIGCVEMIGLTHRRGWSVSWNWEKKVCIYRKWLPVFWLIFIKGWLVEQNQTPPKK